MDINLTSIIAVTNQKGGVGKTTTAVNIAAAFALDQRVLLVDLDPQGNATMGSGVNKHQLTCSMYDVFLETQKITQAICHTVAKYDLLPANRDLTSAELQLLQLKRREYRLQEAFNWLPNQYDWIIIDCPPALSMLTINALVASDFVLIPMQCEYYALEGLTALIETIESICKYANKRLKIIGLVRTMHDARNRLTAEVTEQLQKHFGETLLNTIIPRNVRLAEAPSFGMPALLYDRHAVGTEAYLHLANELKQRLARDIAIISGEQDG